MFSLIIFLCFEAPAVRVHFTVENAGEIRPASAETADVQGVAYLSLSSLTTQSGGSMRLMPARVQIDLGGYTAIAGINDVRVAASQSQFNLQYPILLRDNDAYIALADVSPFFRQAFQVIVEQDLDPAAPALDASAPPVHQPDPELEPAPLLDASAPPLLPIAPETEILPETAEEIPETEPAATVPPTGMTDAPPLSTGAVIVIDPGHGGSDMGYVSPSGITEKEVVLAVALELRRILKEQTKVRIFLTRQDDGDLRIESRRKFAGEQEASLIISLHTGASFSPQAHGIEFFIPAANAPGTTASASAIQESRRIAESLALALSPVAESRGVREAPLRLFSALSTPGVIVEIGFLSNPAEEALLVTGEHQLKIAQGIATGIARAMGQDTP